MEGERRVECQERVNRVHEALFLVGLEGEDGQPHVQRGDEGNGSDEALALSRLIPKEGL